MDASDPDSVRHGCELLDGPGGAVATVRDVVAVTGPDAARFLQGQCSQDLVAMGGPVAWTFLLAPTGKVDAWLRVHRVDAEEYLLEVEPGWGEVVVTRLRRFLLRTDARIDDPQPWTLVEHRWDPARTRIGAAGEHELVAPALAPGDAGVDVLIRPGAVPDPGDDPWVSVASMERHRIAHGMPRLGAELGDTTIPAEAGQWVIDASVSFTKGCYTGQELVARIDSRGGQVPRPVRLLRLDGDAAVGDAIVDGDGAACGVVTSCSPRLDDDRPALALAPVARSVPVGATVTVASGAGPVGAVLVEPASVR